MGIKLHNPQGVNKRCSGCGRYFSAGLDGDYRCLECSLRAAAEPQEPSADNGNVGGSGAPLADRTRAQSAQAA